MDIAGRTALVTGASKGIGEQLATRLAERGADLVIVARDAKQLDSVKARITSRHPGRRIEVIAADLARREAGAEIAAAVGRLGMHVDVLVNNAGVGSHDPLVAEDPDALASQVQLNVGTLVDLTARFTPGMIAAGFGAVINVASTAAFQPVPTMAVYAATKAFVLSFTQALWFETRKSGVRVLALCPGATETDFFATTGKQFLTRGRQSPAQVANTALEALDGDSPVVVSGWKNRINVAATRLLPRRALIRISNGVVAPATA